MLRLMWWKWKEKQADAEEKDRLLEENLLSLD